MSLHKLNPAFLISIVIILVAFRFVPHPPNATPIAAMAIFAGATFTNRFLAYLVPLVVMLLSDLVLGLHSTMVYVYLAIAITVLLGGFLNKVTILKVGVITISASVIFYLLTNFGAWLHHDMYTLNVAGLQQAYIAGLPFLRNALIANLIFTYLLFYGLEWFRTYSLPNKIQS